ncbi:hypothetical protein [Polaribacter sp. 11A2H]|uniref:hypothetical protein n=1 Tax=Polaribacter sp. 11A2H TaxID=2687290 RepID=UPI00140A51A6|nr:hypothetical protein [Polaribacter sp. 11A2H]
MKKIFIITLLLLTCYAFSYVDFEYVINKEYRYTDYLGIVVSIIFLFLIIRSLYFLFFKETESSIVEKSLKKEKEIRKTELLEDSVHSKVEEKRIQERYKEGNKKRLRNLEIKREKKRLFKEEQELNRLIDLEEKEKKKSVISRSVSSKNIGKKEDVKVTTPLKTKDVRPHVKVEKPIRRKTVEKNKSAVVNSNTTKRVNYSTDKIRTCSTQYPVVRKPQQKSIIRSFRLGRNNRKGYKEEEFYNAIKKHFYNDFDIIDNAMLAIGEGTSPYEPDIAMISKGAKNIYIDIEIDEPYAGVSRKLTHCYPEDTNRDNYFVDRGWFVIRFSEKQVHYQIEECLQEIVEVIAAVHISFRSKNLSSFRNIDRIECWEKYKASYWESVNYRENYLNHNFKPYREQKKIIDTALTLEEKLEEDKVNPSAFVEILKTKVRDVPAKKIVIQRKVSPPIIPPSKKEYNSSNTEVSDLIEMAITEGYAIEMKYTKQNGESSLRKISKLEYTQEFMTFGYSNKEHFKGYCHNRLEERSFRVSRINYMKILN